MAYPDERRATGPAADIPRPVSDARTAAGMTAITTDAPIAAPGPRAVPTGGTEVEAWETLLDGVTEAVVSIDADRVVTHANANAKQLLSVLPGAPLTGPTVLLNALLGGAASFEIDLDERRLRGRRTHTGKHINWYVSDVTEQVLRTDALLAERWRSAFLAEASRRLGSSLHRDRTARTIVSLAVPSLADCAIVLLPTARGRIRWHRFAGDSGDDHEPVTGQPV